MKNLDQIRARNAHQHKDRIANSQRGGDPISGYPMLILTDGLLAALAFACEWKEIQRNNLPAENVRQQMIQSGLLRRSGQGPQEQWFGRKHEGEFTVARAIADHLNTEMNRITATPTADTLLTDLANAENDILLRRATAETLAFLNFLKRFVA